ncbi:MAG: biotin/lipoyl-binding protein [Pseudobutyrivibrio sp.]|nr:biotin/lipoyl-binding protein [Pseudobutyrivibrio sp.]
MKNYTITVNGNVYDVTVEDKGGSGVSPVSAPVLAAPAATPAPAAGSGSVKIEAGAAGKVFKIAASAGTAVKKGDPIVILEVMKMETPVVAPQDGTVASINVNEGQQVEAGALLATMN